MSDFVINQVYIDGLTQHPFVIRELKDVGGGRGLFLANHAHRIKKGSKVVMYARHLKPAIPTNPELNYYHPVDEHGKTLPSYYVQISKQLIVEPCQLTPDVDPIIPYQCYNLGILINGACKEQMNRNKSNTRLNVSNSKLRGPMVSISATRDILPGDEVLLSYGSTMLHWMSNNNNE